MNQNFACEEYKNISRRTVLKGAAAAAMSTAALAWLPRTSYAASYSNRDVMISIFLRGGADGLTLVCPYGDDNYYNLRPTIAVPRPDSNSSNRAKDLNGFFGLPPAMQPLYRAYNEGKLAFIHAAGMQGWSRSHFDAMRWLETSSRDVLSSTGWLGRHLALTPPVSQDPGLRGIAMTYGFPTTLAGGDRTLPVPDPSNFGYQGWYDSQKNLVQWIELAYSHVNDVTSAAVKNTNKTIQFLEQIDFANYQGAGGAVYPETDFGRSMKATAALLKNEVGLEAIHIDVGGWDTHSAEGPFDGTLFGLMTELAEGLAAFYLDMSSTPKMGWTLAALSEFGRTAGENDTQGTDHGTANMMIVMGGAVNGKQVFCNWPGLAPDKLFEDQDLAYTTDYRDILSEIAVKRLQTADISALFPNYTPKFHNIVTG